MLNRRSKTASAALAIFASFGIADTVQAQSLTQVGPTLTKANVKAETEMMLRHDRGVGSFLKISASAAATIEVTGAKYIKCRIGYSKYCRFNTGKRGSKVVQTEYRRGHVREAYRVTFTIVIKGERVTKRVTFHKSSSNLLSGAKKVKSKRIKVNRKAPLMRFALSAEAIATAKCGDFKLAAKAGAGIKTIKFRARASSKGWTLVREAVANATAEINITCKTPPALPGSGGQICVVNGQIVQVASGIACQSNSANTEQTAKTETSVENDCKGPNSNSSQCNTTVNNTTIQNTTIIQVNANCSKVTITYGDGSTSVQYHDNNGNVVSEQFCSVINNPPPTTCEDRGDCPPPVTEKCPDGRPIPPSGDCDRPPHIDVPNTPAHLYVNGSFWVWMEAWDEDDDDVSVTTSASGSGTITLPSPRTDTWDGSSCPTDRKCFRARVQASSTVGAVVLTFRVDANGKFEQKTVAVPVVPDDMGAPGFNDPMLIPTFRL